MKKHLIQLWDKLERQLISPQTPADCSSIIVRAIYDEKSREMNKYGGCAYFLHGKLDRANGTQTTEEQTRQKEQILNHYRFKMEYTNEQLRSI